MLAVMALVFIVAGIACLFPTAIGWFGVGASGWSEFAAQQLLAPRPGVLHGGSPLQALADLLLHANPGWLFIGLSLGCYLVSSLRTEHA